MRNRFSKAWEAAALAVGILLAAQAAAEPIDKDRIAVVDGDSVSVDGIEWRLQGLDAPEIDRAKCEGERRTGLLAKRRLEALLAAAQRVEVIDSGKRDRYKRPLGDLILDGANVRDGLISDLYARPYNGGLKKGWCSRDSRDDLIPGPLPSRDQPRPPS